MRGGDTLGILLSFFLVSCSGFTEPAVTSRSLGEAAGLNTDTMSVPGLGLVNEQGGLEDRITETSGTLRVSLTAFQVGHYTGRVSYQSADEPESRQIAPRETTGLPFQWNTPWFPRFTILHSWDRPGSASPPPQPLGPRARPRSGFITYPDGDRERLFAPIEEGVPLPNGSAGPILERRTSRFGQWEMVEVDSGLELIHHSRSGTRTRFANGDCRAICDATEIEDPFGVGVRVDYYDGSSVPRLVEATRRDADGNVTVTARAYFHLRSDIGDAPPGSAVPAEGTRPALSTTPPVLENPPLGNGFGQPNTGNGTNCEHPRPTWPVMDEWLISAISYPSPSSNQLEPDGSWLHTSFGYRDATYHTAKDPSAGYWSGCQDAGETFVWRQISQIATQAREYSFSYTGSSMYWGWYSSPGSPHPFGWTRPMAPMGRMSSASYVGGAVNWGWADFRTIDFQGNEVPFRGVSSRRQTGSQNLPGQARPSEFNWHIRYFPTTRGGAASIDAQPGTSNRQRFHTSVVVHPTGLSTVRYFHPLARDGWPQAARTGLLAEEQTYPFAVWNAETEAFNTRGDAYTRRRQLGYATFVGGSEKLFSSRFEGFVLPPRQIDGVWIPGYSIPRIEDGVGWLAVPSFNVDTATEEEAMPPPNCCAFASGGGQQWGCVGEPDLVEPVCLSGDYPLEPGWACEPDNPWAVCYDASIGPTPYRCLDQTPGGEGVPQCPHGMTTVTAEQCLAVPQCHNSAPVRGASSVVTVLRENRPSEFALHSFSANGRSDYDVFGNVPFSRSFVAVGTVLTSIAPSFCQGRCTIDPETDDISCATDWDCTQDSVSASATNDASLSQEQRFRYLTEDTSREPYIARNLTSLVTQTKTCAIGSACAPGSGLISQTDHDYDHLDRAYPHADAPGDASTAALGRRTWTRTLLFGNEAESPEEFIRYYGPSDAPQQLPGGVAEYSRPVAANQSRRLRFSYTGTSAFPYAEAPTSDWIVDYSGAAHLVHQAEYNGWGGRTREVDENGQVQTTCYDSINRPIAIFRHEHASEACPSGDADAPNSDTRVWYVGNHVRTVQRVRYGSDTQTIASMVFRDGLGRVYQTRNRRLVDNQWATVCESAHYLGHTNLPRELTEPRVCSGNYDEAGDYVFEGRARNRMSYDVYGRLVQSERVASSNAVLATATQRFGDVDDSLPWNVTEQRDAHQNQTTRVFDAFGRAVRQTLPGGGAIQVAYNALGIGYRTTHPDGLVSERAFDSVGRMISDSSPERGTTSATYNRLSQLVESTDARGIRVGFEYDFRGRMLRRSRNFGALSQTLASFQYDDYASDSAIANRSHSGGRLVRATSQGVTIDYGYDARGVVIEQSFRLPSLEEKHLFIDVDSSGAIRSRRYQPGASDEFAFDVMYDANHQPQEIWRAGDPLQRNFFDARGRLVRRDVLGAHPAAETVRNHYDEWGRLVGVNDPANLGNSTFAYRLAYENATVAQPRRDGSVSEVEWARAGVQRSLYAFDYDARGQLVSADFRSWQGGAWANPSVAPQQYDFGAQYNAAGAIERLRQNDANGAVAPTVFGYDAATRRLESTSGGLVAAFAHDPAGNVTQNGSWGATSAIRYTPENRPESVSDGTERTSFVYDHTSNYVQVTRSRWQSPCPRVVDETGTGTESNGDPQRGIGEGAPGVGGMRGGAGAPRGGGLGGGLESLGCYVPQSTRSLIRDVSGSVVAEYVGSVPARFGVPSVGYYVPNTHGEDPSTPSGYYATFADHVGSLRAVVHQSGTVVQAKDYGPYGEELVGRSISLAGASWDSYGTYREFEHESAVDFFMAGGRRLYHPRLGQFLSSDAISSDVTRTGFAYASNNPSSQFDPTGLYSVWGGAGLGGYRPPGADMGPGASPASIPLFSGTIYGAPPGTQFANNGGPNPGAMPTDTNSAEWQAWYQRLVQYLGYEVEVTGVRATGETRVRLAYLTGVRIQLEGQLTILCARLSVYGGVQFFGSPTNPGAGFVGGGNAEVVQNPMDWGLAAQVAVRGVVGPLAALDDAPTEVSVLNVPMGTYPMGPVPVALELQLSVLSDGNGNTGISIRLEAETGVTLPKNLGPGSGGTISGRISDALAGASGLTPGERNVAVTTLTSMVEMLNSAMSSALPSTPMVGPDGQRP